MVRVTMTWAKRFDGRLWTTRRRHRKGNEEKMWDPGAGFGKVHGEDLFDFDAPTVFAANRIVGRTVCGTSSFHFGAIPNPAPIPPLALTKAHDNI